MPYQLHCCTQLALVEEELTDDEEIDEGVDDLDDGAEDDTGPPEHTAPFTVGRSNAPPFLFN